MSNYNSLKTTIDANIKQNGNQEITGQILNSVLNQMVTTLGAGYQFAGVATLDPATDPGTPDAKVFYIANGKGTYTNFGGINVTEDDVVVLYWDTAWHKVSTGIASQAKLSELDQEVNGDELSEEGTHEGSEWFEYHFVPGVSYTLKNIGTILFNAFTSETTSTEIVDTIVSGGGLQPGREITFTATGAANYLLIYWFAANGGQFKIERESLVERISNLEKGQVEVRTAFVSPTGSDLADGSETSPYRTFSKAIGDGNVNIFAEPGNYGAEVLQLYKKHNINISVRYKGTSEYDKIKQNAIIDNSITESVSSDSATGLLKFALSAPNTSNWYKVFVSHTLPPKIEGTQSPAYNVVLWKHSTTNEMEDYKLVPVLSLALCQSTQDSFFYDSSVGMVYINSSDSGMQFKRLSFETSSVCVMNKCTNVHIENLTFKYGFEYGVFVEDSSNISLCGCEADHAAVRANIYGSNGTTLTLNCCKAYKATADGFACSDKVRLDLFNCVGSYNYDDGVSHHRGSEGMIVGGVFEYNGKGGIATPTYNSVVNIYGAISRGNSYGIYAASESTMPIATFVANGCVLADNNIAGMFISRYRCLSINNVFSGNATDKQTLASGSIEEFVV